MFVHQPRDTISIQKEHLQNNYEYEGDTQNSVTIITP